MMQVTAENYFTYLFLKDIKAQQNKEFNLQDADIFWSTARDLTLPPKEFFNKATLFRFYQVHGLKKLFALCKIRTISEQEIIRSYLENNKGYATLPLSVRDKLFLMIKPKQAI